MRHQRPKRLFRTRTTLGLAIIALSALASTLAFGQLGPGPENQITVSSSWEDTPTLGNDGVSDLVVYTLQVILPDGSLAPGDIWYQRLTKDGAPTGPAIQVTADLTDDQLNDVSGDYIVYTAFDKVNLDPGVIMLYRISTRQLAPLARAAVAREPRIYGNNVVWVQGPVNASQIMRYDLNWLGTFQEALVVAGPNPSAVQVAVGESFIAWAQWDADQDYDIWAFDLYNAVRLPVTRTTGIDETEPATSGDWIVWQTHRQGTNVTKIEAQNPKSLEARLIVDNGAWNQKPSIDDDLIAWESVITGNFDVFVYQLSTGQKFQLTTDTAHQYLNDVFGKLVAYVDLRNGSQDIYVTRLDQPPIADAGPDRNAYTGRVILLEGSATDPDDDPIYSWTWSVTGSSSGATFDLQDADKAIASFQGNTSGDYTLELKACARFSRGAAYIYSCGTDYVTIHVAANLPPTATATANPTTVYVGGQVCFDGTESTDPEGGPLTYAWDFGDGTEGSNAPTPCHTYDKEGTPNARLVVTDELGLTDDDLLNIVVRMPNYPPVVSPTATPNSGAAPLIVQFAANATDGDNNPLSYAWNFGDASTSTEASPVHEYTASGTYTVSLTVSDGQASASASLTIAVSPTIQLSVRTASVKWWNKHKTMGMVHVWADLTAPLPFGEEIVRVTFDGLTLLAEPFSAFHHEPWTDSYVLAKRGLLARLDFTRGRLFVLTPKISLIGLDNSNGVDVVVSIGPATAVENIKMIAAPGDRLIYRRAGVSDEP